MFLTDFRRAMTSIYFYAAIVIMFILLLQFMFESSFNELLESIKDPYVLNVDQFYMAFGFTSVRFILPFIAVLPYATVFCDEYQSKSYRYMRFRSGKASYALSKLFTSCLAGGLAAFIAVLLFGILCQILFTPFSYTGSMDTPFTETIYNSYLSFGGGMGLMLLVAFLYFIAGMVWASIGLAVSVWTTDKYSTVVIPFVLYFALKFISDYTKVLWLDPNEMAIPDGMMYWSSTSEVFKYIAIHQSALFALALMVYLLGIRRRMKDA